MIIELDADLDRDAQGEYAVVADDARVMRATAALQANGIRVRRATDEYVPDRITVVFVDEAIGF